jgi:hypothetical protein
LVCHESLENSIATLFRARQIFATYAIPKLGLGRNKMRSKTPGDTDGRAAGATRPIMPAEGCKDNGRSKVKESHWGMRNTHLLGPRKADDALSQPFSWRAGLLFVITAAGLTWYFESEKERMRRKRIADATKGVGKAKVGGPFNLTDHNGQSFSSEDVKGKYQIVSEVTSLPCEET